MGSLYTNRMKKKTKKTIEDRPFVMSSVSFTEDEVDGVLNLIEDIESEVDMFMQDVVEYKRKTKESIRFLRIELKHGKLLKV